MSKWYIALAGLDTTGVLLGPMRAGDWHRPLRTRRSCASEMEQRLWQNSPSLLHQIMRLVESTNCILAKSIA
ncbi:unnamed protein product [Protopolystoma xenopodis]|uniref:Uncharacterized protein n=1 Tax=Protopolystoma xenopodis TaxID=117903 RepID=A0A3S5CRQ6_9PLAT|nr:unnamed protein product [Protopolystoma xenopodis]